MTRSAATGQPLRIGWQVIPYHSPHRALTIRAKSFALQQFGPMAGWEN
jgi:hypothetical protein